MQQPQTPEAKKKQKDKSLEIIFSELNLEQWSVFQPSNSRTAPRTRVLVREITLPDGTKGTARVEVLPTIKGALTTEDQKTFYALIKLWEEENRPESFTPFSLQHLAKLLKKKWGTQTIEGLISSLTRLRATLFTWTNAYFDSSTNETVEILDTFNILSDLRIARRKQGAITTRAAGYYRFNDLVIGNLKNNHTKPVVYETAIGFRSEIAQLMYGRIDRFLAEKTQYERRTKELFDDLGLEGKAYIHMSKRKQMLEPALRELTGKPLGTGRIASATLELTADGKDYKVVFRKGRGITQLLALPGMPPPIVEEGHSAEAQTKTNDQAIELVKYFYHIFFGADRISLITSNSKPALQAAQLIARHGYDQAKFIVDFAHREAKKTGFEIQTFGGIMQYEARAIVEYEDHHHRQEHRAKREAEELERMRLEEEHIEYCRQAIDAYIAEHGDEIPTRIAEKKKELKVGQFNFHSRWDDDTFNKFAERQVRADIGTELGLLSFGDYYEQHRSMEAT